MKTQRVLDGMQKLNALAEVLSRSPEVTRYDHGSEHEAWTIAHALSDIEESMARIYGDQVPRLLDASDSPAKINDLLLGIGEELRHILYHIHDPRFYRYLESNAPEGSS